MAQESYADYSIIHKYLEQQSLHEEELQRYKDNIRDLSESLQAAQAELDKAKEQSGALQGQCETLQQKLTDRDNEIRRLNGTIASLNQKIAGMTKGGRR